MAEQTNQPSSQPSPLKGVMTVDQHRKAIMWMFQNSPNLKCEVCATDKFSVVDDFISLPIVTQDGILAQVNYFIPCFILMCVKCGNTKFINAIQAGIIEKAPIPPPTTSSPATSTPAAEK